MSAHESTCTSPEPATELISHSGSEQVPTDGSKCADVSTDDITSKVDPPSPRSRSSPQWLVLVRNQRYAVPRVRNVGSGAPAVRHVSGPRGGLVHAPLAHRKEDGPAGGVQSVSHHGVPDLRLGVVVAAIVVPGWPNHKQNPTANETQ